MLNIGCSKIYSFNVNVKYKLKLSKINHKLINISVGVHHSKRNGLFVNCYAPKLSYNLENYYTVHSFKINVRKVFTLIRESVQSGTFPAA